MGVPRRASSKGFSTPNNQSAGISDDHAVRKNTATQEGTIEKIPVNNSDIVNKLALDTAIAALKTVQEENRTGAECDGVEDATNRTLTLQNTVLSAAPISCWVDGQIMSLTDLTITHIAANSTIQFAHNIKNSQEIKIKYYI